MPTAQVYHWTGLLSFSCRFSGEKGCRFRFAGARRGVCKTTARYSLSPCFQSLDMPSFDSR